jgi:hypothetical protein
MTDLVVRKVEGKSHEELVTDMVKALIANPAVVAIGGCIMVELLQRVSIPRKAVPGQPGGWSWGSDIGYHFPTTGSPAESVPLLSDLLGSALEVGLILNLAGGVDKITSLGGGLAGLAGILK